jgi:3-methylcrotonyl-CoA carboxylase beta subunit
VEPEEEAFKAPIRDQYERRATRTTPARACGTTASSIPRRRARARPGPVASLNAPIGDMKFGVFRM